MQGNQPGYGLLELDQQEVIALRLFRARAPSVVRAQQVVGVVAGIPAIGKVAVDCSRPAIGAADVEVMNEEVAIGGEGVALARGQRLELETQEAGVGRDLKGETQVFPAGSGRFGEDGAIGLYREDRGTSESPV